MRRPSPQHRYMAFMSYSHDDAEFADWLHEALEEFHVPQRLVGKLTEHGPIPKRLAPIFRDRQELAAASNLTEEIEEAIAGSRFLIVLCSPTAATSKWIDKEIACFKRLHGEDRILAAIIDGEPGADNDPETPAAECFPPALRIHYDGRGRPTSTRAEPIAADLREEGDGRRMGLLKLAAGMLGVGLDELAQREAARRNRRLYLITAASVAGMLLTSGLAYTAIDARDAARDQRREVEGLIGFMLGDLRQKLEPVGRLDVLDAVGKRALEYFEKQDKQSLTEDALAQRSKALNLMGEIAASRGDLDGALRRYREALATTAESLRRAPNDPQRMFDHAQSVFYVGETARLRGDLVEAGTRFREYRRLADRMIAADPDNPKWQLEGVYSSTNLGRVEFAQGQYQKSAATFQASIGTMEPLIAAQPNNPEYLSLMLEALGDRAGALDGAGELNEAIRQRERQLSLLAPFLAQDRPDAQLRQKAMIANMALAWMRYLKGETRGSLDHAAAAVEIGRRLVELEPTNADWLGRSASTLLNQAQLLLRTGRTGDAKTVAAQGCDKATALVARDPTVVAWRDLGRNCLRIRAELALSDGANGEALTIARQLLEGVRADKIMLAGDRFALSQANKLVGDIQWRTGDRAGARASWRAGLAAWPKGITETP
ncbi:MAG TPA: TIR domain-containing protein, partial [Sphingomicrobium sp.]|nr:TIR domain-containing protein [Sphingomicrobium sp.]